MSPALLPGLSIVLPCFDEAENLRDVVRYSTAAAERFAVRHEIVIVDDGSTDDTIAIAGELASRDPRVQLVVHASNRGYGEALRSGIAAAHLPWVLMIDADLQLDVAELENFLAPAASADFVIGRRILMQGSVGRRLGGAVWRRFVQNALDLPIHDVDCAYRLVRLDLLRQSRPARRRPARGRRAAGQEPRRGRADRRGPRAPPRARRGPQHRGRDPDDEQDAARAVEAASRDRSTADVGSRPVTMPGTVSAGMAGQTLDILVCDDDSTLREALRQSFERAGHRVLAVPDGRAAIDRASTQHFDVVLLDVALGPSSPDGYEVCRELRERRNSVAVIMLTALDSEAEAVLGLEAGADDYVIKPFRPAELRSRIRAVLRRVGTGDDRATLALRVGPIELDPGVREVRRDGKSVDLTFSEFEILHALMAQRHRVHSRHELLRAVWGDSAYRDPRSVDVHIRHLREKLETKPEEPELILTVRGAGYRVGEP